MTIPRGEVDVNSRTPNPGYSLIQDYFGEAFCLHSISCNVGNGQNRIHHQHQLKNKWGSHPNGNHGYRWVGGRKPGHGDHLLSPWSIQDGGFWCILYPTSIWLSRAKCGCSKEVHQHSLYPSRVLPSPLSRCEHTLQGCFLYVQFPLDWLHLCWLLPLSDTKVVLFLEKGEMGLKGFPHFCKRLYGKAQKRSTASLILILLLVSSSVLSSPSRREHPRQREDLGFQLSPQASTRCQSSQSSAGVWTGPGTHRSWLKDMTMVGRSNWAGDMGEAASMQMVEQADATFQEVFSQVRLADSIRILPWCVSSIALPLCYMSRVLATTMQQDEDILATTTASEPEGSLAPGPSSSPACPPRTLPLPVPPLPDIPFVGTPTVGCLFAEFLAIPTQKSGTALSSSSIGSDHCEQEDLYWFPTGQG